MGNFAENLNLGNRFRPPGSQQCHVIAPSFEILLLHLNVNLLYSKGTENGSRIQDTERFLFCVFNVIFEWQMAPNLACNFP